MKILLIGVLLIMTGCTSVGKLYEIGEYKETFCTRKLFKKKTCEEVVKKGLHVVKKITVKGTAAKFSFKDGEETGDGASFMPNFSGLQLKNQ